MLINIRKSVFETNSSSSHSMCISKNTTNLMDVDAVESYLNVDGIWVIDGDRNWYERGPVRLLNTFSEKVLYTIAIADYYNAEDVVSEINVIVKKYVPKFNGFGCKKPSKSEKWSMNFGYVQNTGFFSWIKEHNITWEEFLTNSKYFIVVDGDEYNIFTDMAELGLISNDVQITTSWDG